MCGIHGFINGKSKAEVNSDDFLKSGFIANMLRGTDSSGIAVVRPSGFADVAKIPVAGLYLMGHKPAASLITMARAPATASICHVRAATIGNVNYNNAHPFYITNDEGGEIVGVHNGTLTGWQAKKEGRDWDVDSAWALSRILAEKADAFEEFTGAFAFVWWTRDEPDMLCMARNKERPLFIALTEDNNMVYASEAGMIHWLCDRHRIKLAGSIKELEVGRMYKFDINDPSKFTKSGPLPEPKVVTYSSGDMYGWNRPAHETTCDKLDKIFASIRDGVTETPAATALVLVPKTATPDLVTKEEMQDAHGMEMLGHVGRFTVAGADDKTGFLYGEFESHDYRGESGAVMRDVPDDLAWVTGDVFEVKVQGLVDNGNDFIIIVSKPVLAAA